MGRFCWFQLVAVQVMVRHQRLQLMRRTLNILNQLLKNTTSKSFWRIKGAHKWSLILFCLYFWNGAFFRRLVRECCDAVCKFRPAYFVGYDCHRGYACEAYCYVHTDFGYSSPAQVLHHKLEFSSFEASLNRHP